MWAIIGAKGSQEVKIERHETKVAKEQNDKAEKPKGRKGIWAVPAILGILATLLIIFRKRQQPI